MALSVLLIATGGTSGRAQGSDDLEALHSEVLRLYQSEKYSEAIPLAERYVALSRLRHGEAHLEHATALDDLATLLRAQDRFSEAEALYKRSLAIRQKVLGPDHPDVCTSLDSLAGLYRYQSRYAAADAILFRTLALCEAALGPDHLAVGVILNSLASSYSEQDRVADAEALFTRSLAIFEKTLGPDHFHIAVALDNLAGLYFSQKDWTRAVEFWRRSTQIAIRNDQRGTDRIGQRKSAAAHRIVQLQHFVSALYDLDAKARPTDARLSREAFVVAQRALGSEGAQSLTQMAMRRATDDPSFAPLGRERRELVADWQKRDAAHTAAVSKPIDKRDQSAELMNTAQLAAINERISRIDQRIKTEFPEYAALIGLQPLSIEDVQAQLGRDEALVFLLDRQLEVWGAESFIWVVTRTDLHWVRSDMGGDIAGQVAGLRCGLDAATWSGSFCSRLYSYSRSYTPADRRAGKPLPFNRTQAYDLYKALFAPVEKLIQGKHLLVVASGRLTTLPLHVLVTAPPAKEASFAETAWLGTRQPITVLPSVVSLAAVRTSGKARQDKRPYIGFGNPLLDGDQTISWQVTLANQARDGQHCDTNAKPQPVRELARTQGAINLARAGAAAVAEIRRQLPLPETADELCSVGQILGAPSSDIKLGAKATETEVKALSESGALAEYRVVHFATHGALSGDVQGSVEPGLILTPPDAATDADDGYLTASEIAAIKLDADLVILSACNTAGDVKKGAEALSGLARAFFHAGARALLVSYWSVESEMAVKLITAAFAELESNPGIARAEALRQAMQKLVASGDPLAAHPASWAPFVLVGEGASAK